MPRITIKCLGKRCWIEIGTFSKIQSPTFSRKTIPPGRFWGICPNRAQNRDRKLGIGLLGCDLSFFWKFVADMVAIKIVDASAALFEAMSKMIPRCPESGSWTEISIVKKQKRICGSPETRSGERIAKNQNSGSDFLKKRVCLLLFLSQNKQKSRFSMFS